MDQNNFVILPHPSTNFEIQKYYQNEPRFTGVFLRDNLPNKTKDGAYIINLGEYADTGTNWIALLCTEIEVIYFENFGVNMFLKKLKDLLTIKI